MDRLGEKQNRQHAYKIDAVCWRLRDDVLIACGHHPLQVSFKHNQKKPIDGKPSLKSDFKACNFDNKQKKFRLYEKIFLTLILS